MSKTPSLQTAKVVLYLNGPATDDRYGGAIAVATGIPVGSLYPILHGLARAGLVRSCWEGPARDDAPNRGRRRYYALTAEGRELASRCADEADRLFDLRLVSTSAP